MPIFFMSVTIWPRPVFLNPLSLRDLVPELSPVVRVAAMSVV